MKADEIRALVTPEALDKLSDIGLAMSLVCRLLAEQAAQLAELNERLTSGDTTVRIFLI
jgi:hypothetical protein